MYQPIIDKHIDSNNSSLPANITITTAIRYIDNVVTAAAMM